MTNVYYGPTPSSIVPVYRYTRCPHCGGELGGYPRLAHPHGHRWYSRCHECNYGAWELDQDAEIRARLAEEAAYPGYVQAAAQEREQVAS